MRFLFNLLRIKGHYMFRALLTYPQEAQNKRYLVYYVRVMSVGYTRKSPGYGVSDRALTLYPGD
jgi:hypothetical protein